MPITDASSVGEARRRGLLLADRLGFDAVRSGEFGLLITEVSRNILLHGGGGQTIMVGARMGTAGRHVFWRSTGTWHRRYDRRP